MEKYGLEDYSEEEGWIGQEVAQTFLKSHQKWTDNFKQQSITSYGS